MNKSWLVAAAGAAGLSGALYWSSCRVRQETREDVVQHQAIAQADTHRVTTQRALRTVRHATDSTLAAAPAQLPKPRVQALVQQERAACDSNTAAADHQVQTRQVRVTTLERRASPFLSLYARAGLRARLLAPRPQVRAGGEVGVAVQLDPATQLQLGVTDRQEIRLYVQRTLRVF